MSRALRVLVQELLIVGLQSCSVRVEWRVREVLLYRLCCNALERVLANPLGNYDSVSRLSVSLCRTVGNLRKAWKKKAL